MNADGSDLAPLLNAAGSPQQLPMWSADGTRVLALIGGDLYIMAPDGSEQVKLTNSPDSNLFFDTFGVFDFGPPMISSGGIVSANLAPLVNTISPLSIVSVFGVNFAQQNFFFPVLTTGGQLARILGGVCFEVAGQRVPIFAVTPTQANIQISKTGAVGPVGVVAVQNCDTAEEIRSAVEMVTLEEATPVFFLFPPRTDDGLIAARFNSTAIAVAPDGMFIDQFGTSRPAKPGDIIALYGTGWGETDPPLEAGELAAGAAELVPGANPSISIGGIVVAPEDVFYFGATPGTAGLHQVAIRIPANTPPGNQQVVITVYGISSPVGPVIPIAAP